MFDDLTGVEDNKKQEALNVILFNIRQMFSHGLEGDIVSETISDISLKDVDRFLFKIANDQDTKIKLLRVRSSCIEDPIIIDSLFDYVHIEPTFNKHPKQMIYFLESSDFAIGLIPVDEGRGDIRIHMEPLECYPDFVTEIYNDLDKKKGLDSIKFIKLQ
jgi:hypothetical protein